MTAPVAIRRLDAADQDFARHLDHLLSWESVSDDAVNQRVLDIIQAVRERGDAAVVEFTQHFDGVEAQSMAELILPRARLELALTRISAEQRSRDNAERLNEPSVVELCRVALQDARSSRGRALRKSGSRTKARA